MLFKGVYTIKKSNEEIISYNSVQQHGFSLMQDWFVSDKNSNIRRIDLFDSNQNAQITQSNINSDTLSNVTDIFNLYDGGYIKCSSVNSYFSIDFGVNKKIKAIGIDAIQTTSNTSNGNIAISYVESETQINHDNFVIPVLYKNSSQYNKTVVGQQQKIYFFNEAIDARQLKIKLNSFSSSLLAYRIYSIYIYEQCEQYLPPTTMTLYNVGGTPLITKTIDTKFKNTANYYSIVYKSCLQLDDLQTTDQIYAISTDYYDYNGVKKQFSYSVFPTTWAQQAMQTVQLQYQLFFGNQSSTSDFI